MKIGRLEKVDPRKLWAGEATDFTPWLAKEENIELLGETVGIELEVISEEKSVGPFRADILCKSTLDNTYVLVENQLEKTDHNHLGQLMTYAAGLEAVTIIWIAKKFTEEHRAALDWLNRVTDENLRFFGIELEVYKIGNSEPAPFFQLISKPNDWTKAIHGGKRQGQLNETKTFYLEYWTAMRKYFEASETRLKHQKPQPQHWMNFAIGKSYFNLGAIASIRDNFNRVELDINGIDATNKFLELRNKYEQESYSEISENIVWDEIEGKQVCMIYIRQDAEISNRSKWEDQFKWLMETLEKFDTFFRPKIKALN